MVTFKFGLLQEVHRLPLLAFPGLPMRTLPWSTASVTNLLNYCLRNEAWGVTYNYEGTALITGGRHNSELAIWELSEEGDSNPLLSQRVKFEPPSSGSIFNHMILEPEGRFLFVANAKSTTFVALHLQNQSQ